MKNLLAVSALVLAVAPAAMASKARVDALSGSRHVVDFQTAFDRPYQFMALSTQATIEWGANGDNVSSTPGVAGGDVVSSYRGEAGFLMKNDDMAWGVYFGRRSDAFNMVVNGVRDAQLEAAGASLLLLEQNPINAYYASKMGDWTYGITVKYSNGKKDDSTNGNAKSSSMGLALGVTNGTFDVDLVQGIVGKSEVGDNEIESKGMTSLTVGYHMNETMEVYGNYSMLKADVNAQAGFVAAGAFDGTLVEANTYEVGFVHQLVKTEDMNFFYGVAYQGGKTEKMDAATKTEVSKLPVWMGVEAKASENLVLRGSVAQNVILNTEEATNGDKTDVDSLAINAGLGYKLGKGMLDANLTSVRTGTLGFQDDLLSQVSYTFNF